MERRERGAEVAVVRERRRLAESRRWCWKFAVVMMAGAALTGCSRGGGSVAGSPSPSATPTVVEATPTPGPPARPRLVFTYFFYWYDAYSGQHLRPADGLRDHFPASPAPSYKNLAWLQRQLEDMAYAGIDVVLPDYWGFGPDEPWSADGLDYVALARQQMLDAGQPAPKIGMFFDTTIVAGRDLTTPAGKAFFYANVKDFFTRIPRGQWALIDGRPVVSLFTSDQAAAFDQSTFDDVYANFARDFGVRPYIIREASWDYPIVRRQDGIAVRDLAHPIVTDDSYLWGGALNGYVDRGGVAEIGPGYDDTLVPGRHGVVQPRDGGWWYRSNFEKALASGKSLLAIETWNEIHEGTAIGETQEYGRQYLEMTREFTAAFHAGAAPSVLRAP
ncbi:MAG TPA: DUF5010 domain-containing protein [Dehalococcoidia bacterium]|nr:DUF5010 domain-containing protein [Dehalococcoidia bacterium]